MDPNRCRSIEEVVDRMWERWRRLDRARDWRAVFAKTYLRTTEAIGEATARPGVFENPDWVVEIDCEFAWRYFEAFDRFEEGGDCPWPWQVAFQSAKSKRTLAIQDVLLGMNAHINYDLPYSLAATVPPTSSGADLEAYRRDNQVLNEVLGSAIDMVQRRVASRYDVMLGAIDAAMCDRDEAFAGSMIRAWRARSWNSFMVLRTSNDPPAVDRLIEESAVDNALLLLEVQRAFPFLHWPNRAYRGLLWRLPKSAARSKM